MDTPEIDLSTEGYYRTKDIYLASALIASGFPVIFLKKYEQQYTFFFEAYGVYEDRDTWPDKAEEKYWSGELQVDAKALWSAYKELKSRMYHNL